MKKIIFITLLLLVQSFTSQAQSQFEVNGVAVPRTIEVQKKKLDLNGFGTRSKAWMDLYVQALYLTQLTQDGEHILEHDADMAIRIQIVSKLVSAKKFSNALEKGFDKSCGEKLDEMKPQIELLKTLLTDEIVQNDVYILAYDPLEGAVSVFKNDVLKGKVPGIAFKKALFGIWLSNNPVDEDLKKDLLGIY